MRLIDCAACHTNFYTTRSDAEAAASFEAEHHIDHASVPTVSVCHHCAEAIRAWRMEAGQSDALGQGGRLH